MQFDLLKINHLIFSPWEPWQRYVATLIPGKLKCVVRQAGLDFGTSKFYLNWAIGDHFFIPTFWARSKNARISALSLTVLEILTICRFGSMTQFWLFHSSCLIRNFDFLAEMTMQLSIWISWMSYAVKITWKTKLSGSRRGFKISVVIAEKCFLNTWRRQAQFLTVRLCFEIHQF